MKNYSSQESSELRKTLEYAEAVALIGQQHALDRHRNVIKEQLKALKRLSRGAVDVARSDILSTADCALAASVTHAASKD